MPYKIEIMLAQDESTSDMPYFDKVGIEESKKVLASLVVQYGALTIGKGHNLLFGIPTAATDIIFQEDLEDAEMDVGDLIAGHDMTYKVDDARFGALINMRFNLGNHGFKKFEKLIQAVMANDWQKAHDEVLNSRWAEQLPARAGRVARMLLTGEWPEDLMSRPGADPAPGR